MVIWLNIYVLQSMDIHTGVAIWHNHIVMLYLALCTYVLYYSPIYVVLWLVYVLSLSVYSSS